MKKAFLWLSGVFTPLAVMHLARVALKIRLDVNLQRVPLKVSAVVGLVSLVLAVIFLVLSKDKK